MATRSRPEKQAHALGGDYQIARLGARGDHAPVVVQRQQMAGSDRLAGVHDLFVGLLPATVLGRFRARSERVRVRP